MELQDYFKKLRDGEWVTVPGTDVQIHVVGLDPRQVRRLGIKHFRFDADGGEEAAEAMHAATLDACVVGWKNIKMDGKDLPCTSENKRLLDDTWVAFSVCWQKAATRLGALRPEMEAAERKNS